MDGGWLFIVLALWYVGSKITEGAEIISKAIRDKR